jgi:hypothetical protein
MSCDRVSLFVNVTLCPTLIVTVDGLTAEVVPIVIVAATVPTEPVEPTTTAPPPDDGEVGEPPHAAAVTRSATVKVCAARIRVPQVTVSSRVFR